MRSCVCVIIHNIIPPSSECMHAYRACIYVCVIYRSRARIQKLNNLHIFCLSDVCVTSGCVVNFELDVDVPSDWPWRIRNSNRVVTSGLPPMCVVDFELE